MSRKVVDFPELFGPTSTVNPSRSNSLPLLVTAVKYLIHYPIQIIDEPPATPDSAERRIALQSLHDGIDTSNPAGVLASLVELELELGRERRAAS
ncbi:hypothetical protein DSM43276_01033 [Mycobacteroides salmoniphilum]|nr:hypothetical protein DSM43276_01033 [Mycobacteroides salmoniphilum]